MTFPTLTHTQTLTGIRSDVIWRTFITACLGGTSMKTFSLICPEIG